MRGRWASAALGAGIARRRMGAEMDRQAQAYEAQQQASSTTNRGTAKANRISTTTKTATTSIPITA